MADDLIRSIRASLPGAVLDVVDYAGETTVVAKASQVKELLRFLKERRGFDYLVDITSVHWPEEGRVDVVYLARSLATREQLRVRTAVPEEAPEVPSVTDLWGTANWLEREVYDLMGVRFEGHPDLKRILLPEDFEGHPLRKEYPMEGDDEWRNYLRPEEGA